MNLANHFLNTTARLIATVGGVGLSPFAPGTCGTAVAVILASALYWVPSVHFLVLTLITIVVGSWAAHRTDAMWNTQDSGRIVIDEVAGYFVTVSLFDRNSLAILLIGFVAFRILDILKPPPIRWMEHNLPGGIGVVLDDVAAGILAAAVLWVLVTTHVLDALPPVAIF